MTRHLKKGIYGIQKDIFCRRETFHEAINLLDIFINL
jgi:hypothetical protein